ncbi:hypothetical protein [Methylobacterium sp.]|uniref:hypothetical protein n=1 Tax=Methylobacterium sp. TaxID=409 RepID=UPI0025FBB9A4|nr:hypothetical protein [Methylobacterium sp.]MBY0259561.1 hypothetical protein [Methylobacterium sp.]
MARATSKPSAARSMHDRQRAAIRQAKTQASAAPAAPRYTFPPFVPPVPEPQPARGAYRIEQLRLGQCRFACTADDAPRHAHRFCGAPTEIGRRNPFGSWCPEHLDVVTETSSRLAQPAFLKNTARSVGR